MATDMFNTLHHLVIFLLMISARNCQISGWKLESSLKTGNLTVESGDDFTLTCNLTFNAAYDDSSNMVVRWLKYDKFLYSSVNTGTEINSTRVNVTVTRGKGFVWSSLTYPNAILELDSENMVITCLLGITASDSLSKEMHITIVYGARIITPFTKHGIMSVENGKNFSLTCRYMKDPTIADSKYNFLYWMDVADRSYLFSTEQEHNDSRVHVTVTETKFDVTSTLTFMNARVERDSRQMKINCYFVLDSGFILKSGVYVNIIHGERIDASPRNLTLTVQSGSNFDLSCKAFFNPHGVIAKEVSVEWWDYARWLRLARFGPNSGPAVRNERVKATLTHTLSTITSSLTFLNATVQRDSDKMNIDCIFKDSNFLYLKRRITVNIAYNWTVRTSQGRRSLQVKNGENFSSTCTLTFDPRQVADDKIYIKWGTKTRHGDVDYPYFHFGSRRRKSPRVKLTERRTRNSYKSTITFLNATIAHYSDELRVRCLFASGSLKFRASESMKVYVHYDWKVRTLSGSNMSVESGKSIKLVCMLTFDPREVPSSKITVTWRNRKRYRYVILYTSANNAGSERVRGKVNRTENSITSSVNFSSAAMEREHKEEMVIECIFSYGNMYSRRRQFKINIVPIPMSRICGRRPRFRNPPSMLRIVGGHNAGPGEVPWNAYLRLPLWWYNYVTPFCGGSVIHNRWILTAAHCITDKIDDIIRHGYVVTGNVALKDEIKRNRGSHFQIRRIKRYIIHLGFEEDKNMNDIALVELATPLRFDDFTQPICLADHDEDYSQRKCGTAGFGDTKETEHVKTSRLQKVSVPVMKSTDCKNKVDKYYDFVQLLPKKIICTLEDAGRTGVCHGDSGTAVYCRARHGKYVQVGVVAGSKSCISRIIPSISSKVSEYLSWIRKTTKVDF